MNDPRPLYERAADQFASLLKTVTPERLGDPTPCTEFDVRALLSHVVGGTHRIATIGEGGDGLSVPARVRRRRGRRLDHGVRGGEAPLHRRRGRTMRSCPAWSRSRGQRSCRARRRWVAM